MTSNAARLFESRTRRNRATAARTSVLLLTLCLCALCFGFGQSSPSQPAGARSYQDSTPTAPPSQPVATPTQETIALRAQLEVMRQYDQRLLATVYWSLAVVITLVLALITIIGFLNLRVYERDKAALRQELMAVLREELAKSEQGLRQSMADFQRELRSEVTRGYEGLSSSLKSMAESVVRPLTAQLEKLGRRLTNMEFKQAEDELKEWMTEGVYSNALRASLKMLQIARESDQGWRLSDTISYMKAALQAALNLRKSVPTAELAKDVSEAIDSLPAGFSADAENLRGLLKRARAL